MDTFFEISSSDKNFNKKLEKEVEDLITKIDKQMNCYNETSEVATINQLAGRKEVPVSKETFRVLKQSIQFSELTDGLFDVTFQPIQDLYGFKEGVFHIPDKGEIEKAKQLVDYRKIIFNESYSSILLNEPGMKINLSGFLKGYVLDQVKELLLKRGVNQFLINFGGNIGVLNNKHTLIGVKHPRKEAVIHSFSVKEGFVSTSADYQQFFEKNGIRYTHIVNPKTGGCIQKMQTVSVVAETGILSDFLSTTLFLLEPTQIPIMIKKLNFPISVYAKDGVEEYKYP